MPSVEPKAEHSFRDVGYLYLPLTARLKAFTPWNTRVGIEYGGDPITFIRKLAGSEIPIDVLTGATIEYRLFDVISLGLRYEEYRGSLVRNESIGIKNPPYVHQMYGAYVYVGE